MYMTARRIKIEGKPILKLNIHEFEENDIPFLDSLGIDQVEGEPPHRYTLIHNQENFLATRSTLLEKYTVLEEKGSKVFLKAKR